MKITIKVNRLQLAQEIITTMERRLRFTLGRLSIRLTVSLYA